MKLSLRWKERPSLLVILLLAALYFFFDFIHFGCVFEYFFHIPCPGCGMTRALKAALVLDWKTAFSYHPMVFSLPLVAGYILTNGHLFKHKVFNDVILILIGVGFIICYIIKLFSLIR